MKKLLIGLIALVVLFVGGVAIFLTTVDANNYRSQIAEKLSEETGRTVKLTGPISLGLSWSGATLSIRDASISNPSWATKPEMAGIGSFNLGISVPPLLDHKLVITRLEIKNADIDLEADADRNNWTLTPAGGKPAPAAAPAAKGAPAASSGSPVAIHVDKLAITDSQIAYRDLTGKLTVFKVSSLTVASGVGGVGLKLDAEYNGTPIALNVKTGATDLLSAKGKWPFDADLTYANYKITTKGNADLDRKRADISNYEITSGKTALEGALDLNWGGAKPSIQGSLGSEKLDPADFKSADAKGGSSSKGEAPAASNGRVFSDAPLGLDGLKAANASLNIKILELVLPKGSVKNLVTILTLRDGLLTLSQLKTELGKGQLSGEVKVAGGSVPPQISVSLTGANIDLEDLLSMAGAPDFLSGKSQMNLNLAATGDSAHGLASTAVGVINITAENGNVSSSAAGSISSSLMQLFAPGGSTGLNCLAARFIVKGGVMNDNGILVDTGSTTVAGSGNINLGQETLNMGMRAKPKLISAASGLLPPLNVTGTFTQPHFGVDPTETIQKVAGLFMNGGVNTGVPDMQTAQGQNACVYTLDHPKAAASPTPLPSTLTGKASDQIKNIGGALKGLGIFGQ